MLKLKLQMPDVSGKTVEAVTLHDDDLSSRELTIRFTDGTELSVAIESKQLATVRYFEVGGNETFYEQSEAV